MISTNKSENISHDYQQLTGSRKSILKPHNGQSPSECRKSAHWDENNILCTIHSKNDTFQIGENNEMNICYDRNYQLNSTLTSEKLQSFETHLSMEQNIEMELDFDPERSQKKKEFEEKRKAHYKEHKTLLTSKKFMKYDENHEEDTARSRNVLYNFSENSSQPVYVSALNREEWERKRPKIEDISHFQIT